MPGFLTMQDYLDRWQDGGSQRQAVSETVQALATAGIGIAKLIGQGPLAGDMARQRAVHADGDAQKELDAVTNIMVLDALKRSPVAFAGSEENDKAVALNLNAPLAVNIDPLDGSSNIDTNVSVGTIFSILPATGDNPLLQAGHAQLAAGYIMYGPQTAFVLSVGEGTQIFWLDDQKSQFLLVKTNVRIPAQTNEYSINSSNFRHWDDAIKAYVIDCKLGADGPRKVDFNMRWIGSMVADTFRILTRGGIYLYPGDARNGYTHGRLRLLYEANPIAMIIEQAGGACTTGSQRMLTVQPQSLHQRVPLIFGSKNEVEEVLHYYREPHSLGDRSPLFSHRGLFRSIAGQINNV